VSGYTAAGWEGVRTAFERNFEEGRESGAQLSVYVKGRLVVDLVGGEGKLWGRKHEEKQAIKSEDRIPIFSCSKVLESLTIALAVSRGYLRYDESITKYWPKFGKHGKDKITVAQLMRHQAGLPILKSEITLTMAQPGGEAELDEMIEDSRPAYEIDAGDDGTWPRQVYHAITRGTIASALLRKVDPKQRDITSFFREEIIDGPIGFNISLGGDTRPTSSSSRLMSMDEHMNFHLQIYKQLVQLPLALVPHTVREKLFGEFEALLPFEYEAFWSWAMQAWREVNIPLWTQSLRALKHPHKHSIGALSNDPLFISASSIPSANGAASARSLALLGTALAGDGTIRAADGHVHRILTESDLKAALEPGPKSIEEFLSYNISFTAAGFGVDRFGVKGQDIKGPFMGWAGVSGSLFQFSPRLEISVAYLPTFPYVRVHKPTGVAIMRAILKASAGASE